MASTYLQRTQGTATSRKIFTISVWVKRANLSAQQQIFETWLDNNNRFDVQFTASDKLLVQHTLSGSTSINIETSRLFRDTSAWYHIVVKVDTTQATASDRVEIYINGSQETSLSPETYPSQNLDLALGTSSYTNFLGKYSSSGGNYFDGEMTHYHFSDGTAYDASTFGETDATTGIWKPKTAPSVTYGTNGFFLKFENSGAFGTDSSGNGNNFTVNGTMTQTIDTPSNVFATFNPLAQTTTKGNLSNGNLTYDRPGVSDNWVTVFGTEAFTQGKYYFEYKIIDGGSSAGNGSVVGLINYDISAIQNSSLTFIGGTTGDGGMGWYGAGNLFTSSGDQGVFSSYTDGDIVMVAVDADNGYAYWGKNGSWINSGDPTSGATGTGGFALSLAGSNGTYCFGVSHREGGNGTANFGNGYFGTTAVSSAQNPDDGIGIFEYDVPTGYRALCTKSINAEEYS